MTGWVAIFRSRDWVPGVLAVLALLALHAGTGVVDAAERLWYDYGVRVSARPAPDDVAIVAIDDASLAKVGGWPGLRRAQAQLVDRLSAAGARVVVLATPLAEAQAENGLDQLQRLSEVVTTDADLATHPVLPLLLRNSTQSVSADAQLAHALQTSGRTYVLAQLSPHLNTAGTPNAASSRMPAGAARSTRPDPEGAKLATAPSATWPLPALAAAAAGVGHAAWLPDPDGVLRSHALWLRHEGRAVPSLALLAAARFRGVPEQDVRLLPDGGVQMGSVQLPTTAPAQVRTRGYAAPEGGVSAFAYDPAHAVLAGTVPAARHAGKLVLVGLTASGFTPTIATPQGVAMNGLDILAQHSAALVAGHLVQQPPWARMAPLAALAAVVAYLLLAHRLATVSAVALTAALAIGWLAASHLLLTQGSVWMQGVLPVAALVLGHSAMLARQVGALAFNQRPVDVSGVQAQRALGLSLLKQGQLELAWDQLRQVPMALLDAEQSAALMHSLYELGTAFEKHRQFTDAQDVYAHLVRHDQGYRDVAQRLLQARSIARDTEPGDTLTPPAADVSSAIAPMAGGAAPSGAPPAAAGAAFVAGGAMAPVQVQAAPAQAPQRHSLGRFRVERELGRGAMGVVYLGSDPQSGRSVAIKTMALSQEFSGDQLDDARQRFRREAQTAGRLRHPDIVTIVDAGEDGDLAYIAMEMLGGMDLSHYTRPGQLLPVPQVLATVARVAEALAFAHKHGVVHRDIKPANVMIDVDTDQVKVTDFGIARVTDASKTRTGAVLGTPSYMSPEQLAGRRLDGRSDLYSLGVMLFQLLTGQLPLRGESMAALMYAIANTPAPDVRSLRPELPQTLAEVVALALEKRPEVRYADGHQLASDLRTVAAMIAGEAAGPASDFAAFDRPTMSGELFDDVPGRGILRAAGRGEGAVGGMESRVPQASARAPAPGTAAPGSAASVSAPSSTAVPGSAGPGSTAPVGAAAAEAPQRPARPAPSPPTQPPASAPNVFTVLAAPREDPAVAAAAASLQDPNAAAAPGAAPAKGVRGVWRSAVRMARRDAQAELFADTQPSQPVPLDEDGFGHNRPG